MKPHFTYAGRLERCLAYLLDTLLLFVPHGILGMLIPVPVDTATYEMQMPPLRIESTPLLLAGFLCNVAYFTWFVSSRWQASPGQRALGMHIVHADGSPLDMRDAAARFLAFSLPVLPMYASFINPNLAPLLTTWLIGMWYLPILIRKERTGMHDSLCNTRVVAGKAKGS